MQVKTLKFVAIGVAVAALAGACKPVHTSGVYNDPYTPYPTSRTAIYQTSDGRVFRSAAERDRYIYQRRQLGYDVYAVNSGYNTGLTTAERQRLAELERLQRDRENRRLTRAERRRLRALEEERRRLEAEQQTRRDARRAERRAEREARRRAEQEAEERRQRRAEREARRRAELEDAARRRQDLTREERRQRRLEREARRRDEQTREERRQRRLEREARRRAEQQLLGQRTRAADNQYYQNIYPDFEYVAPNGTPYCASNGHNYPCGQKPRPRESE